MTFHALYLRDWSIFEQLELEEALLRTDDRNVFIISEGSKIPSIVMGISGKIEEHVDFEKTKAQEVPVIRRFSGGGTVVVDEQTLFVTFIADRKLLEPLGCSPESIMRWAEEIFRPAFSNEAFRLRENDFVIGEKKCGGNAQYLQKQRWLLHTSFLWDFRSERLNLLRHPPKTPDYRQGRSHEAFVCRLSEYLPSRDLLIEKLQAEMAKRFSLEPLDLEEVRRRSNLSDHRRATCLVNF